jgi:hypothetical protein
VVLRYTGTAIAVMMMDIATTIIISSNEKPACLLPMRFKAPHPIHRSTFRQFRLDRLQADSQARHSRKPL